MALGWSAFYNLSGARIFLPPCKQPHRRQNTHSFDFEGWHSVLRTMILHLPQANPYSWYNTYKGRNPASAHYPEQEWSHLDNLLQRRPWTTDKSRRYSFRQLCMWTALLILPLLFETLDALLSLSDLKKMFSSRCLLFTSLNTHNIKLHSQAQNVKCNFESKRWLVRRTGTTTP